MGLRNRVCSGQGETGCKMPGGAVPLCLPPTPLTFWMAYGKEWGVGLGS